jgi:uncharacterized protein YajQ (UPF0234 family)
MAKLESKEKAFKLYMIGQDNNDIADIVEVQPKTVGDWAKAGKWKEKREAQSLRQETNEENVQKLITYQLRVLNAIRSEREKRLEELLKDSSIEGNEKIKELHELLIEKGQPDGLQKLHTIIKGKDTEWTTYVQVMREFVSELREADSKLATTLTDYVNEFLNNKRKEL